MTTFIQSPLPRWPRSFSHPSLQTNLAVSACVSFSWRAGNASARKTKKNKKCFFLRLCLHLSFVCSHVLALAFALTLLLAVSTIEWVSGLTVFFFLFVFLRKTRHRGTAVYIQLAVVKPNKSLTTGENPIKFQRKYVQSFSGKWGRWYDFRKSHCVAWEANSSGATRGKLPVAQWLDWRGVKEFWWTFLRWLYTISSVAGLKYICMKSLLLIETGINLSSLFPFLLQRPCRRAFANAGRFEKYFIYVFRYVLKDLAGHRVGRKSRLVLSGKMLEILSKVSSPPVPPQDIVYWWDARLFWNRSQKTG